MTKFRTQFFKVTFFQPWIMVIVILISGSVLEYAGLTQWLRTGLEYGTQPIRTATVHALATLRTPVEFARISAIKYTYFLDLELKYSEAMNQLSELERLKQENQDLKKLLEGSSQDGTASSSAIIGSRRFVPIISYAQPTISIGSADGVDGGEVVRVSGVFVGKVTVVAEHQAQVRLLQTASITDPVLGKIKSESGDSISGIVTGNGTQVMMKEIPIEAVVEAGQQVETIGQFGIQPGLYIGRVKEVLREEGSPTQTIILDQGVSFFRTTLVEVLL